MGSDEVIPPPLNSSPHHSNYPPRPTPSLPPFHPLQSPNPPPQLSLATHPTLPYPTRSSPTTTTPSPRAHLTRESRFATSLNQEQRRGGGGGVAERVEQVRSGQDGRTNESFEAISVALEARLVGAFTWDGWVGWLVVCIMRRGFARDDDGGKVKLSLSCVFLFVMGSWL